MHAEDKRKILVVANAFELPFNRHSFDLINLDALLHHLIDSRGYLETVFGIVGFLRSLRELLKPDGKVLIREIYHESIVQADMLGHLLYALSVLQLPKPLASLVALGIRSQGRDLFSHKDSVGCGCLSSGVSR